MAYGRSSRTTAVTPGCSAISRHRRSHATRSPPQADTNAKDNQGRTALMAAASNGDAAVVHALLAGGADPRAADASGGVALTYAAAAGSADDRDIAWIRSYRKCRCRARIHRLSQ